MVLTGIAALSKGRTADTADRRRVARVAASRGSRPGAALVAVMKSADRRDRHDASARWPLLFAQASDPRIGPWKLDVAKSKYSPGPPPKGQTLKIEPSGQGEKVTSEVVTADGTSTTSQYTANFDGKDY